MFIEIQDLWKRYPGNWALRGVNLEAEEGRVVGILGENGSGKSTLFRILAGISLSSKGTATIDGENVGLRTRRFVSFMPEIDFYYSRMKIEELGRFLAQFYPSWDWDKNRELLQFMGLEPGQKILTLSKGQKTRLRLVCAFSWKAKLVLLDEPIGAIDPVSRKKIVELLFNEFKGVEQTVMISTHMLFELEKLFDDVAYLDQGEVVLSGKAQQLRDEYSCSLTDIYEKVME